MNVVATFSSYVSTSASIIDVMYLKMETKIWSLSFE